MDTAITHIEEMLHQLLAEHPDLFIVKLEIQPTNNIKIYLDGDNGIGINTISKLNRGLYKLIEESGIYPDGSFSLEVSSPGADEPLSFPRQYAKHIGRTLEVSIPGASVTGKLLSVSEEGIVLEEVIDKKKKLVENHSILFNNITKAIVQISF